MRIAALLDLAENAVLHGDTDQARARLAAAAAALHGDLVFFGWRLDFKRQLISSRLALLDRHAESALEQSAALADAASRLGVPRYSSVARLLGHLARAALGGPVDPATVEADLGQGDASVAIESCCWAGDLGAALGVPEWIDRAESAASALLGQTGPYATGFERFAGAWIEAWRRGR